MPRPIHFELPADDMERAAAFYEELFGWKASLWGDFPYWLVTTGVDEPGIDGAITARSDNFASVVNVIEVPSVDVYLGKVEEAGGTVVIGKQAVPGVGYSAYCLDTEGNRFGLFETDETAQA